MSLIVKIGKKGKRFLKKYLLPEEKHSISYTRRFERIKTDRRICAMTFDDGPMDLPATPDRFGGKSLTDILLLIVTPAMFLDCMQAPFDAAMLHDFFLSVGLGFLAFLLTILAARYLLFGGKWTIEKAIDRCCVVYSNAGFIGIPLVAAGWGDKGIMLATGYILAFNIVS